MTWLIYIFAAYLAACYLWGAYLVVRLYTGKRLRVLVRGPRRAPAARRRQPASAGRLEYAPAEQAVAQQKAAA